MSTGTIVGTFVEGDCVCLAVRVAEASGENVEYIGRVPLSDLSGKTDSQKKAALVAAVKAVRNAQQAPAPAAPTLSGSVTL